MGNFGGHALPGSLFILIALWHLPQISIRYFRLKRRIAIGYKVRIFSSPNIVTIDSISVKYLLLVTMVLVNSNRADIEIHISIIGIDIRSDNSIQQSSIRSYR